MTIENKAPTISIAVTTFNGEGFLRAQMDSLLAQTFQDFEILVSDDASTDATLEILEEYQRKDSRITIFRHTERQGLQKNFDFVMRKCTGDFIAPCDQDDIWLPQKLEVLLALIKQRQCSLVYCNSKLFGTSIEGRELTMFDKFEPVEGANALQFAFRNCVSGHATLFDRSILPHVLPIPENPMFDWWLAAVASSCKGIAFTLEPLVLYRQHEASTTDAFRQKKRVGSRIRGSLTRKKKRSALVRERIKQFRFCPNRSGEDFSYLFSILKNRKNIFFNVISIRFLYKNRILLFGRKYKSILRFLPKMFKIVSM
ncbi:glycosyltransferase [Allorhizobium terrae]|uniref:Glycosyltransferase n=1 Tax=Allorhizobium terrae TaxID=1848972 RepID=A0A4S3ZVC2_9HYPH|nr:glycosyltransferase [Allorhizobium terrae]THF49749.1 glycosyltransferase [Allorhizobium terrae]